MKLRVPCVSALILSLIIATMMPSWSSASRLEPSTPESVDVPSVTIIANDDFTYSPAEVSVVPGQQVIFSNGGYAGHSLMVPAWGIGTGVLQHDESRSFTIPEDAQVGTEVHFNCTVSGHEKNGMVGTFRIVSSLEAGNIGDGPATGSSNLQLEIQAGATREANLQSTIEAQSTTEAALLSTIEAQATTEADLEATIEALEKQAPESSNPKPSPSREYVIQGVFILRSDSIYSTTSTCGGTGGYRDIREGTQVTALDAQGNVLGYGKLEVNKARSKRTSCYFTFEISVPKSDFYQISLGRRGELVYSFEELEAMNWKVELRLGD